MFRPVPSRKSTWPLGEKDEAFEGLEKAYNERSLGFEEIKVNPVFDPLRSDPRFQDLLRRMNLQP